MNTPILPQPPKPPSMEPLEPVPGPIGPGSVVEALLKKPGQVVYALSAGKSAGRVVAAILLVALAGLVAFGLAAGSFSGGVQWWAAPVKITVGTLFAALICLPSLYIFVSLSGANIRFGALAGLLAGTVALSALLLAGLTPVVWVFSQSTESLGFMGTLMVLAWLTALLAGLGFLRKGARWMGLTRGFHLHLWTLMFLVVTLQMSCALRPILGTSVDLLPKEKRFFLGHWAKVLGESAQSGAGDGERSARGAE